MKDKFEVLHQYYGYTSFREGQAELIDDGWYYFGSLAANLFDERSSICAEEYGGASSICK